VLRRDGSKGSGTPGGNARSAVGARQQSLERGGAKRPGGAARRDAKIHSGQCEPWVEGAYLTDMRFHQDSSSSSNLIRSYGAGEIKINDTAFRAPVIVSSSAIEPGPAVTAVDELAVPHAAAVLAHEPEVVLLGTGLRQSFPTPEFGAAFLRAGVGFEVMDTGAACRTFNVLVAEQRRVVALLIP
jgi:uncharacterized protein